MKLIPWGRPQVVQTKGRVQEAKLAAGDPDDVGRQASRADAQEHEAGALVSEALDHGCSAAVDASAARSARNVDAVEPSAIPSTWLGRKWRWNAVTTATVSGS